MDIAREVARGTTEYHWRAAAIHAYYALFLECRDALFQWGPSRPRRDNVHTWVRLRFAYATDQDLKELGRVLDNLVRLRNQASYDLQAVSAFASPAKARKALQDSVTGLALLDAIEADPTRRAAAIASLPP